MHSGWAHSNMGGGVGQLGARSPFTCLARPIAIARNLTLTPVTLPRPAHIGTVIAPHSEHGLSQQWR